MIGMPFLLMIVGIAVVGLMSFCASTLDYATQKTARQIMVGTPQSQNYTEAQVAANVLCPLLPAAMFDCSKIVIDLDTVIPNTGSANGEPTPYVTYVQPNLSAMILPPLTQGNFCMGTGSSYEVMRVLYPLPAYLSVFSTSTSPTTQQGQYVIMTTAAFRNEPFTGSASTGTGCRS